MRQVSKSCRRSFKQVAGIAIVAAAIVAVVVVAAVIIAIVAAVAAVIIAIVAAAIAVVVNNRKHLFCLNIRRGLVQSTQYPTWYLV